MTKLNLYKVIYLNSVISIFQSAVNVCLNIMSQIFEQNGFKQLGNLSVFLIFTFGLIGNFFCVTYVKKYPFRIIIFTHALGYLCFVAQGILVSYCYDTTPHDFALCSSSMTWFLVVSGSSITGFLSSGFWISQNDYISEAADGNNIGLFYGIGWALVQTSQLIGSLYSAYMIESLGQFGFFCTMFLIGVSSSFFFLFVPEPKSKLNRISIQEEETSPPDSQQQWSADEFYKLSISSQLRHLYHIMKLPKVILINFPIMMTGIMLSFQYTVMHLLIENSIDLSQGNETINSLTFKVMISLGFTEVLGGLITGYLNNVFPKVKVLLWLNILFEMALVFGLVNVYVKNYTGCFVIAALWGFVDCGTTTTLLAILSEHFGDDVRIFCNFNIFQCIGGMMATLLSILLKDVDLSIMVTLLLSFQIIANLCMQAWKRQYT